MKKLMSWLLLIAMLIPLGANLPVLASSEKFELLSVTAINDYQLELKFSEDLRTENGNSSTPWIVNTINNTTNVKLGIALVSDSITGQEGFGDPLVKKMDEVKGTVSLGATNDTLIWTVRDIKTANSITNIKNTWKQDGYTVKFYLYDNGCPWHGSGYIGAIQAVKAPSEKALSLPDGYTRTSGSYEYMFMDITPPPAFEIVSATALSDFMVELKFSRDLHTNIVNMANGSAQMGLALVSNTVTGQETLGAVTTNKVSGSVALGATNDTLIWTANEGSITKANSISSLLDASTNGYSLKFYLYDNGCPWHGSGYIGAIQGVKVGTVETALPVPAAYKQSGGAYEYMFVDINTEALDNDLELVSVKPINEYTLQVTFNKAVDANSTNLNANLRLLNANDTLYYNDKGQDFGYSIGNALKATEDPKVWTWTMPSDYAAIGSTDMGAGRIPSPNKTINYALDSWKDKLEAGSKAVLMFLDPKDTNIGYSRRVQAVDGGYLRTTQLSNGYEWAYQEVSAFAADDREGISVESATIISDNQIKVVFSDAVTIPHAPWISLRILNEAGGFIDNQTWQKRYASYTVDGNAIVFTFDADMMDMLNLEGKYANIEGAVKTVLNVEELAGGDTFKVCYDGYIDNITAADGKLLKGNLSTRADYDGLNIELGDDTRDELITVESVIRVSDTQIEVTFSAPVEILNNPYIALRVYDESGNLQRFTHDGQNIEAQVPFTWTYSDDTKTKITLMYPDRFMNDMLDLTGQFAYLKTGTNKTYLTIEEKPAGDEFKTPGNGLIDNIVGESSKLAATVVNTTGYERIQIEVAADTRKELTLVSATIISGNEIILKFSDPVEIGYAPFLGLRIMDENMKMVFNNGSPVQIYQGTWEFTDDVHDTIKWTSKDWILEDMLNLRGEWAKYKDLGYQTYFCIEELQDKEGKEIDTKGNGYIDNVVKADGKMLTASMKTFGEGYDGLYITVTEDYQEPAFYLKKVTAINTKQLALEFNKPVQIDALAPYMAIRYVDDSNGLQYDGKTPLQYQGKWDYGNKEKTVLIWTQTFGGSIEQVIKQTDSYRAYAKYNVMFCIEEIPADKEKGDVEDGTIHNVYTDGDVRLYANKIAGGTGWDGLYMPITIDYDYEVPGTVIASVIQSDNGSTQTNQSPIIMDSEKNDDDDRAVPTATGPASDKVLMAIHTDHASNIPWIALGIASAVFVGIIAILFVLLPKKKDEQ